MALTAEQQNTIEFQAAQDTARLPMEQMRIRLELVRMAKEALIETARSKPVEERDVTAADVVSFATTLNNYVNQ